jgi:cell division protein ZapA
MANLNKRKSDGEVLEMIERKPKENPVNSYTVTIMGDDYVIRGNDDPEYMQKIAEYLEEKIQEILTQSQNQRINKCQTAVLAALKIADELHKSRQKYQYPGQPKNYQDQPKK